MKDGAGERLSGQFIGILMFGSLLPVARIMPAGCGFRRLLIDGTCPKALGLSHGPRARETCQGADE
jgi:hypothetical protein